MGYKVQVDEIENVGHSSGLPKINENFEELADEFDLVHYRDGSLAATDDWDMDSNRILNLPTPLTSSEPLRLADLTAALGGSYTPPTDASLIAYVAAGAGSAIRTVEGKLQDGAVSVKDKGAEGDGVTNDFDAIIEARDEAIAENKALLFPAGTYLHDDTLEFGFSNLRVIFEGNVILEHTGTGKAVSFDSGATSAFAEWYIEFGWGNAPTLQGNINTTDLLYVRGCHHMKVDVRLRDCTTGVRIEFSVLSKFNICGSGNEEGFSVLQPTNWLILQLTNQSTK